jgi:hypothetical protein
MTALWQYLRDRLSSAMFVCVATLQEIFDESAYARFLARTSDRATCESYAAFLREQAVATSRRHRCC